MSLFKTPPRINAIFQRILSGGKETNNVPIHEIDDSNITKRRPKVNKNVTNFDNMNISSISNERTSLISNKNVSGSTFEISTGDFNDSVYNDFSNKSDEINLFAVILDLKNEIGCLKQQIEKQQHTIELQTRDIVHLKGLMSVNTEQYSENNQMDDITKINSRISRLQCQMSNLSFSIDDFKHITSDFGTKLSKVAFKINVFDENFSDRSKGIIINLLQHLNILEKHNANDGLHIGNNELPKIKLHHNLNAVINDDLSSNAAMVSIDEMTADFSRNKINRKNEMDGINGLPTKLNNNGIISEINGHMGINADFKNARIDDNNIFSKKHLGDNNSDCKSDISSDNFNTTYITFDTLKKCDNNLYSNDIKFRYFIRKFKYFANYIEIEINDCDKFNDVSENIERVKSKILRDINNINNFEICSSIKNMFVKRSVCDNSFVKHMVLMVKLNFPLNFQFFALTKNNVDNFSFERRIFRDTDFGK